MEWSKLFAELVDIVSSSRVPYLVAKLKVSIVCSRDIYQSYLNYLPRNFKKISKN